MLAVIIINCLLAGLIGGLAIGLWRWRCQLQQLTARLRSVSRSPKQLGYGITLRRVQLAETRLGLVQLKQRSHQASQALRLLKLLRLVAIYRAVGAQALLPRVLGTPNFAPPGTSGVRLKASNGKQPCQTTNQTDS